MSDASSLERRRARRITASIPVEVRDGRGFSLHSCRDVSAGGLFFDRAIPHAVGSRVQLAFTLPGDDRTIRCDGEVVNVPDSQSYGMGVRFVGLMPADEARLLEFTRSTSGDE